ncbi:MAG: ROK family protein [Pleurocapsa minor GSE-CHR-MK-17-07R]|jgi:predicted NBD/HSP70 family sugar kinase|nr:ROK family protein [Pleurocapsa minor GSE-CHR-MK 17-07R]
MADKKILVIDVGGSRVKCLVTGEETPVREDSGPDYTPEQMVEAVKRLTAHWQYDVITLGLPGVVKHDRMTLEPVNLGVGWADFDFQKAFDKPIKVVNDAAMQAVAAYEGGRMLFLGFGTGLGSTMIVNNVIAPMELGHLPYRKGKTFEQHVGGVALAELGKKEWRRYVDDVIHRFFHIFQPEYIALGGGNTKYIEDIPEFCRVVPNVSAFYGGFRMWDADAPQM